MSDTLQLYSVHTFGLKHGYGPSQTYSRYKEILEEGHDPNEVWDFEYHCPSPLFDAVYDRDLQLTKLLLDYDARINDHYSAGLTVLHEAVMHSYSEVVQFLLDHGADVDSRIQFGFLRGGTALHIAAMIGEVDILKVLIEHGASTYVSTDLGWTIIDITILEQQKRILQILLPGSKLVEEVEKPGLETQTKVTGINNSSVLASHLIEHGIVDTDARHVKYFHNVLHHIIRMCMTDQDDERLSTLLVRNTHTFFLNQAGTSDELTWSRNLCDDCPGFEDQDVNEFFSTYQHKQDFESLVSSANDGCNMCHFLQWAINSRWCLLDQIDVKYIKEFGVSPVVRLQLERKIKPYVPEYEHELIVVCGDKVSFIKLDHVQRQLNDAILGTSPTDTQGSGSNRSFAVARAWLQRCEDNHQSCRRPEYGPLPTRVIDVGSVSEEPYVYVSAQERIPYAALSYCWGNDGNIRLLTSNVEAYTQCLPCELLPQTIADAILMARGMNVKYLWVDSLCILQDSEESVQHELLVAGEIYSNASFTIAAKDSPSCTSGLFCERSWTTSAVVPTAIKIPARLYKEKDRSGPYMCSKNTRTSCFNRLMAFSGHHTQNEHSDTRVLETRGWALQEDLLSHRVLKCGKRELSWACSEGSCSERSPKEVKDRVYMNSASILKRYYVPGVSQYGKPDILEQEEIFNFWLETVEGFLYKGLLRSFDKLPAISGIQKIVGNIVQDEPLAGIWKGRHFAASLLWYVDTKDTPTGSFRCPSWSWASSSKTIKYIQIPHNVHPKRWAQIGYNKVKYFPELVAIDLNQSHLDHISGYLTINCHMLREAVLRSGTQVVEKSGQPFETGPQRQTLRYTVQHDSEEAVAPKDAWLMVVRTSQQFARERWSHKYPVETHLLRLVRISPDTMNFRRVGLVIIWSWINEWHDMFTEQAIHLY